MITSEAKKIKNLVYEKPKSRWEINPNFCKSCGLCILKCPVKALAFDEENNNYLGTPIVGCDITKCIACGTCQNVCPDCAITVEKG
jgi:2-oxoglutarate ferredoxin oxidoreductase subunit delta